MVKGPDQNFQGRLTSSCFSFACLFLLSSPSFLRLPSLLLHWLVRHTHIVNAGRLLFLGISAGLSLRPGWIRRRRGGVILGVGRRDTLNRSYQPSSNRFARANRRAVWGRIVSLHRRLGYACYCCADDRFMLLQVPTRLLLVLISPDTAA